jgi:hypothetical protein
MPTPRGVWWGSTGDAPGEGCTGGGDGGFAGKRSANMGMKGLTGALGWAAGGWWGVGRGITGFSAISAISQMRLPHDTYSVPRGLIVTCAGAKL